LSAISARWSPPGLAGKTAALGFSLIQNHLFVDGNKREATVDAHQR